MSRELTTHAERVQVSRLLPPPSALDMLEQARRIWREPYPRMDRTPPRDVTLLDALNAACVDLRDGWLERPPGVLERIHAERMLEASRTSLYSTDAAEVLRVLDEVIASERRTLERQALRERAERVYREVDASEAARVFELIGAAG